MDTVNMDPNLEVEKSSFESAFGSKSDSNMQ